MSAHGISPAWRAGGTGVPGPSLVLGYHTLQTLCELDLIGDVTATINLGLVCTIDDGNVNGLRIMEVACDVDTVGDVTGTNNFSIICAVVASDP